MTRTETKKKEIRELCSKLIHEIADEIHMDKLDSNALDFMIMAMRAKAELLYPDKTFTWSWRYLAQVKNKTITPGGIFVDVLQRYHAFVHDQVTYAEAFRPQAQQAMLTVLPGVNVPDGTLITIDPSICAMPGCGQPFVKNNVNHRYCSAKCRKLASKKTAGNTCITGQAVL